jgi:hypothetical protein
MIERVSIIFAYVVLTALSVVALFCVIAVVEYVPWALRSWSISGHWPDVTLCYAFKQLGLRPACAQTGGLLLDFLWNRINFCVLAALIFMAIAALFRLENGALERWWQSAKARSGVPPRR